MPILGHPTCDTAPSLYAVVIIPLLLVPRVNTFVHNVQITPLGQHGLVYHAQVLTLVIAERKIL